MIDWLAFDGASFSLQPGLQPRSGVSTFRAVRLGKMVAQRGFAANGNGASDSYQGTTSVVPTVMAGIKGFSPMCFSFWGSANTT
jgi:hypothetical protein